MRTDASHLLAELAPIARNNANSRIRWATRMEKVLTMMNVPTTNAIGGEDQQEVGDELQALLDLVGGRLGGRRIPGDGFQVGGEEGRDRGFRSCSCEVPSVARHPHVVEGVLAAEIERLRLVGGPDRRRWHPPANRWTR
jgi:hypothetical protein